MFDNIFQEMLYLHVLKWGLIIVDRGILYIYFPNEHRNWMFFESLLCFMEAGLQPIPGGEWSKTACKSFCDRAGFLWYEKQDVLFVKRKFDVIQ